MTNLVFIAGIIGLFSINNNPQSTCAYPLEQESQQIQMDDDAIAAVAKSNNQFAIELYKKLSRSGKNEFISPYSISSALAMTYLGANGETQKGMQKVLHFGDNVTSFHQNFQGLNKKISSINQTKGLELNIANRLWGSNTYKFRQDFLDNNERYYGAGLTPMNFVESEGARQAINQWVEDKTKDKIKDLIPKGAITPLTKMVLTNAIYFNADWAIAFNKEFTMDNYFRTSSSKNELKSFMNIYRWTASLENKYTYKYTENDQVQVLELPYNDNKASMIVVLPRDVEGLKNVIKNLSSEAYTEWIENLKTPVMPLNISLPKWKNTANYSLGEKLKTMGMEAAFDGTADFSKMSAPGQTPLHISAIIHKAFVDVSEKGTEAAAATAVIMNSRESVSKEPQARVLSFIADHPFLYFIKDNETNSILFMGQVVNPKTE